MNKEIFLKQVITELKHIKRHATPEELNKLSFITFNKNNPCKCIYGQMTGNCDSTRAQ